MRQNFPSRIKIAIFLPSLAGGGAERVMVSLANGFVERGFFVNLVLVKAKGPYLPLVSNKVRVVDLNCSRVLPSLPRLITYLKTEKPNAMLSTLDRANILSPIARSLARVPTRVFVRPTNSFTSKTQHQDIKERLLPSLMRWSFSWTDGVISVSNCLKEEIAEITKVPHSKIHTIPNPIVAKDIARANDPLDHSWFFPKQPPVILGVGRLNKQKDFPTLIYAFAKLRKQQPARLIILGEGQEREHLESLVKKLYLENDVSLPGFVDNPFQYIKRASVFVLSSRWEGMPNVLLQAMACGTPVIATNCPGGSAEILENGRWGKLIPIGDVESLSAAIMETLKGEVKCPSLEMLEERFGLDQIINQYLSVLLNE